MTLRVSNADFDDSELAAVMEACKQNRTLQTLDLSRNGIGGANEFYGAAGYSSKVKRLQAAPLQMKPALPRQESSKRSSISEAGLRASQKNAFQRARQRRNQGGDGFAALGKMKTQAEIIAGANETVKKAAVVASIAEKTGMTKKDSEAALAAVLETIQEVRCN